MSEQSLTIIILSSGFIIVIWDRRDKRGPDFAITRVFAGAWEIGSLGLDEMEPDEHLFTCLLLV